jgi:hypothetical protein
MSDAENPPGGLSWAHFESICADVGSWTWGTVQGAFNEKASFSQIIVDAVIGMIPVAGDVTAVRDLIAIVIGIIDEPKKRESVWSWILLVVLLLALIPVFGGVAKGVGRIVCKVFEDASKLVGPSRVKVLAEGAQEVIKFLNRIGAGNAERWFNTFHLADHQAALMEKFNDLTNTMYNVLGKIKAKAGSFLPDSMAERIDGLREGLQQLKKAASDMIPKAIKEFDQDLRELQAYIHSGGETTSRTALHEVATGDRAVTRAEESRLIEDGALPERSARGGWKQNKARANDPDLEKIYKPEPGYPDLTKNNNGGKLPWVAAYSGKITNRELQEGEQIYRYFGKGGSTHGVAVGDTSSGGAWWGLGHSPSTAKEWREKSAVLDEWNRDGFVVTGKIGKPGPKACVGTISEQAGKNLPGQYLEGGGTQAFFFMNKDVQAQINYLGKRVMKTGKTYHWTDQATGMVFELKPTGWTDANGIWGYIRGPSAGQVATVNLAKDELADKKSKEVVVAP